MPELYYAAQTDTRRCVLPIDPVDFDAFKADATAAQLPYREIVVGDELRILLVADEPIADQHIVAAVNQARAFSSEALIYPLGES